MGSHEVIIKVQNLVKKYGEFTAVRGIEFEVNRGEVFGLLGPNGAGKTTTLEMLVGLRKPDQGTAKIAQFDIIKDLNKVKEVIGVQLQSTTLFELLTVEEILHLYASFYSKHVSISWFTLISFVILGRWHLWRLDLSLQALRKRRKALRQLQDFYPFRCCS